jgi:hypothetical protein
MLASGQSPSAGEAATLLEDVRAALRANSLSAAADAAGRLDGVVQKQRQAWLIRDAKQRVEDVLTWLPADTESLWVNQVPFTVEDSSASDIYGQPVRTYSLDRLAALDEGRFYRALMGHTVRLVIAAGRAIQPGEGGIPGFARKGDITYVYFLDGAIDLGAPGERIEGKPAWRATARIDDGAPIRPGQQRTTRDDENWLALAGPDILLVANQRDTLRDIVMHLGNPAKERALPAQLPEWAHVDTSAAFWGLRHYPASSLRDGTAAGATAALNAETGKLEILYFGGSPSDDAGYAGQFRTEQIVGGWRLEADIRERGVWPVHFAFAMLGFGPYR